MQDIDKQLIENYIKQGFSCVEIAELIHKRINTVRKFLKENGLNPQRKKVPLKDRINKRYGKLIVIEKFNQFNDNEKGGIWKCLCDCGNTVEVEGNSLNNSKSGRKSCGCLQQKYYKSSRQYEEATISKRYQGHKMNGNQNNHNILDRKDWESIVFNPCHYCGKIDIYSALDSKTYIPKIAKMTYEEIEKYKVKINGIDRIDSSKDYSLENCVPCCSKCNYMKNDYTQKEFLQHIENINSFQKSKIQN